MTVRGETGNSFLLRWRKLSTTIEGFISLTVRVATCPGLPRASVGIIAQSGAVQCSSRVTTSSLVEQGDKGRRHYHWPLIILFRSSLVFLVAGYKVILGTFGTDTLNWMPLLVLPKVFSNCFFLFPPGLQVPEEGFWGNGQDVEGGYMQLLGGGY